MPKLIPPTSGLNGVTGYGRYSERAKAVNVCERCAYQSAIDFRLAELDRKIQRRIQDGVEIVGPMRKFPEVFGLDTEL